MRSYVYIGICIAIILIQLVVPENIEGSYTYLLFLTGILVLSIILYFIKREFSLKEFKKSENQLKLSYPFHLALFVELIGIIAISSFFYFLYVHTLILENSVEKANGIRIYEYKYRAESFFLTSSEYKILKFWEYSTFILIPLSLGLAIINGLKRKIVP